MGKSTIHLSGFPGVPEAEAVKSFVEQYTGKGTVYALEVRVARGRDRAIAKVQFIAEALAQHMVSLADQRELWYDSSYLKAWQMDTDLHKRSIHEDHNVEPITLHFGCQIGTKKFTVLWGKEKVAAKIGVRRMCFELSHASVAYKIEVFYDNIGLIKLHRSHHQTSKFLLVQLYGAPRVFEKLEDSIHNYFTNIPDDQWIRTTDFTPSFSIGQSSSLCLEMPLSSQLPNFHDSFQYYKESKSRLRLESGSSFLKNSDLVPLAVPPEGLDLPYRILFKVCSLVQIGSLSGPALDAEFFHLVNPMIIDIRCIEHSLERLFYSKECCFKPVRWLNEQYERYHSLRLVPRQAAITSDSRLMYVYRVQITPCKVYCCGPEVNLSNRVLRKYGDDIENFLRVSFVDEQWEKLHSPDLSKYIWSANVDKRTAIYDRILSILRKGISIGNKKFEFLAFSSSQLRENSTWMFASRPGLTAADIRAWMGDFHDIRNVAKYAARLGQSFGSSIETFTVPIDEFEKIPDIEVKTAGIDYVFSDGIGKISADFARKIAQKCGLRSRVPSAFQIRYGGYKGVVAVDPNSAMKLSLRKSMFKYESQLTTLDVLSWSKYHPCFLNRQLITLLSTLGVQDHVFETKQREVLDHLEVILQDDTSRAQKALELLSPGENIKILKEMLACGFKPDTEPFLMAMLQTFQASRLFDLRTKSKIYVSRGRSLMGCMDETRTLEYGQVFIQLSDARRSSFQEDSVLQFKDGGSDYHTFLVTGKVVVGKNPCLHPGDVRVLDAIDVPSLHHMVDCVVFPQKGPRPHPNECSGSDLDGDIYFVCWDPELIPPLQYEPMEYAPQQSAMLDHDVTIEEVQEYFTNYIANDSLGVITHSHTAFADKEVFLATSEPCLELARLFSIAVDSPKTGIPVEIPSHLRAREYPDFMERHGRPSYESGRVLGKLYREVRDVSSCADSIKSFTLEVAKKSYDYDLEVDGFHDYIDDAFDYKTEYDNRLGNILDYYGIQTEAELMSGCIMKASKLFDRKRDGEVIALELKALRKEAKFWFYRRSDHLNAGLEDFDAKASAWYHVTYHPMYWGCYNLGMNRDHYLSFPWCVYEKLVRIKKERVASARMFIQVSSPV